MAKYIGNKEFKHGTEPSIGILLVNLGTPDAPNKSALRKYLKEFLSDPRVIEVPKAIWWFILNGFILNTRPAKSAEAYEQVWTENGSPLLNIGLKQKVAVAEEIKKITTANIHVELAMRYGNPSIPNVLNKLREKNLQRLLVLPLYPQYAAATTASTFDAVTDCIKAWRFIPELRFINHYHDNPNYISALVESIRCHWAEYGKPDKLLFSYHGIPKDYFLAGDPYHCECYKTTRLVIEQLGLNEEEYLQTFQSRFGPREWLKPYTDETLKQWGADGVNHVQVICPGFSADCLETIEEINIQNREFFLSSGGKEFSYIPALNDNDEHIDTLVSIIKQHSLGWPEFSENYDNLEVQKQLDISKQQAEKFGAE